MRFITALLNLVLLICPCALCYGQISFASVSGEGGYAAMRGSFMWDLDNGLTLIPAGGFYRISDKEEDETGTTGKVALMAKYELTDTISVLVAGHYIPRRLGFENMGYWVGLEDTLCYHCGPLKNPYVRLLTGQSFYDITAYANGQSYPKGFNTTATIASGEVGTEVGKFFVQARYDKVIKYNHRPPSYLASNWTEIPFMTAIIQGFISDGAAGKISYRTRWLTPYAVYARYKYLEKGRSVTALGGGLSLVWGKTILSGGIENFESNWEAKRRNYFSFSASMEF